MDAEDDIIDRIDELQAIRQTMYQNRYTPPAEDAVLEPALEALRELNSRSVQRRSLQTYFERPVNSCSWLSELFVGFSELFNECAAGAADAGVISAGNTATEPQTPQQRALPRPSTTPPMWAQQPNRNRRGRNR